MSDDSTCSDTYSDTPSTNFYSSDDRSAGPSIYSFAARSSEATYRSVSMASDKTGLRRCRRGSSSISSLSGPEWEGTGRQGLPRNRKKYRRRRSFGGSRKLLHDLRSFRNRQSSSSNFGFKSLKDIIMAETDDGQSEPNHGGSIPRSSVCSTTPDDSNVRIMAINLFGETTVKKFTKGVPVKMFIASTSSSWRNCHEFIVTFDLRGKILLQKGNSSKSLSLNAIFELNRDHTLVDRLVQRVDEQSIDYLVDETQWISQNNFEGFLEVSPSFHPISQRPRFCQNCRGSPVASIRPPSLGHLEMRQKMRNFLLMRAETQREPLVMIFNSQQEVEKFIDLLLFLQSYTGTNMATLVDPLPDSRTPVSIIRAAVVQDVKVTTEPNVSDRGKCRQSFWARLLRRKPKKGQSV